LHVGLVGFFISTRLLPIQLVKGPLLCRIQTRVAPAAKGEFDSTEGWSFIPHTLTQTDASCAPQQTMHVTIGTPPQQSPFFSE
jgi:hypothetical protein